MMGGDSENEPNDSRNVTGTAHTPDGHFTGDRQKAGHGGEYEPRDSRNVTGTASTADGRWTNQDGKPPAGVPDNNPANAADAAAGNDGQRGRDDTLEDDLDRERLEPGPNTDGKGDVGADTSRRGDQKNNA
jgi:hypothetical protein